MRASGASLEIIVEDRDAGSEWETLDAVNPYAGTSLSMSNVEAALVETGGITFGTWASPLLRVCVCVLCVKLCCGVECRYGRRPFGESPPFLRCGARW